MQLIYTAILSRILTPEDFGTITIVNVFIVFFQLLSNMGFSTGVIQNKNLSKEDLSNIYSFTIYLGIILMIAFAFFSFPLAKIYNDDIYIPLGAVLSLSLAFNAFNMIPSAILLKEKNFLAIAIRTVVVAFLSYSSTILFALNGVGVFALAASSVINAIGLFLWNIISVKLKFRFKFKLDAMKKIWVYSMYQFGAQVLNYFNRNLDNLLIGKFFTKSELGYYNKSFSLILYPISYLPGVITPVLHPVFSDYESNKIFIYDKYIQIVKFLSLVSCFVSAFFVFAGEEIILIVFGAQWIEAVLPFRIISFSLLCQIITNTVAPIYQSVGNTKLMFFAGIITTAVTVILIIIGILTKDIVLVSLFVSIAHIIIFLIAFYCIFKLCLDVSLLKTILYFKCDILIFSVLMIISVFCKISIDNIYASFGIKLIIMAIIYVLLLIITKQYKNIIGILRNDNCKDTI